MVYHSHQSTTKIIEFKFDFEQYSILKLNITSLGLHNLNLVDKL